MARRIFSRRYGVTACAAGVELRHQDVQQAPDVVLAWITTNAADFAALIDQNEQRCQSLRRDEGDVSGQRPAAVDAAQRRALALVDLEVDRRALGNAARTPH